MYASDELNIELYKLSGWETSEDEIHGPMNCPEYSLGYLLRKLPHDYEQDQFITLETDTNDGWEAAYSYDLNKPTIYIHDDTPEDAACFLAIALFKAGILTK